MGASTIGAFPVSVMQMSAKLSLTRPEAATGLRFRRKPGTTTNPMVGLLKATDTDIPENALLNALKEGKADAQFATWKSLNEANTASVQSFVVETNHRFSVRLLLTNKEWQDSLPAGFRTRFDLAYRRAMAAFNRETLGNLQKHKAAVLDKTTVLTLTRKQHNAWRQVVETLWEDYVANADNAELLKRLERANRL